MDPTGKRPLFKRAMVRRFVAVSRNGHAVCPACLGVLYWLAGADALKSVAEYQHRAEHQAAGKVQAFLDACSPSSE